MAVDDLRVLELEVLAASHPVATRHRHAAEGGVAVHHADGEGVARKTRLYDRLRLVRHVGVEEEDVPLLKGEVPDGWPPVLAGRAVVGLLPLAPRRRDQAPARPEVAVVLDGVSLDHVEASPLGAVVEVVEREPRGDARGVAGEAMVPPVEIARRVRVKAVGEEVRVDLVVLSPEEGLRRYPHALGADEVVRVATQGAVEHEISEAIDLPTQLLDLADAPGGQLLLTDSGGLFQHNIQGLGVDDPPHQQKAVAVEGRNVLRTHAASGVRSPLEVDQRCPLCLHRRGLVPRGDPAGVGDALCGISDPRLHQLGELLPLRPEHERHCWHHHVGAPTHGNAPLRHLSLTPP
mmetsp:Transcript_56084/g.112426  ORF Transcript_56084/g.112426 Transcript_56084/m.112426 type:complete len:348 (-) Transcript_56084:18-1061(-)